MRIQYRFWLDDTKQAENELMSECDNLKKERSFTSAIRDGLRLIVDLRQGNTDVLFELFPHLRDKLRGDNADDNGNLKRDIERLERLILQNQATQDTQAPVGLKGLQSQHNTVTAPVFDDDSDDDDLLEVTKSSSSNANSNFLKSMLALQGLEQ